MIISSQDFQNAYEKFYAEIRKYLWSFETLKKLAQVEVDIYERFIDFAKLRDDFARLHLDIRDTCKEDEKLNKCVEDILDMLDTEDAQLYARLPKVEEVNPEQAKQIRTIPEKEEEE